MICPHDMRSVLQPGVSVSCSSTVSQTCEGANTPTSGTMATIACVDASEADAAVIVREFVSDR